MNIQEHLFYPLWYKILKKRKEYKNETYSNHRSTNVKLKYRFLLNTLSKFTVGDHKCLYK